MVKDKDEYDWDRYHDLIDIKETRELTPSEMGEFNRLNEEAKRLDAIDALVSEESCRKLEEKHFKNMSIIDNVIGSSKKTLRELQREDRKARVRPDESD